MGWSFANIDWGATGTWVMGLAQVVVTGGVVVYTERRTRAALRREEAARRAERLETIATVTRLGYSAFTRAATEFGANPRHHLLGQHLSYSQSQVWLDALGQMNVAEVGDADLLGLFLSFRAALERAASEVQTKIDHLGSIVVPGSHLATELSHFVGQFGVDLFNKAAAVERTVARLNARVPLDLPQPFTG